MRVTTTTHLTNGDVAAKARSPESKTSFFHFVFSCCRGGSSGACPLIALGFAATLAAAAPEPTSVDGTTPLHLAVRVNDLDQAKTLIHAGANVNAANRLGVTPLSLGAGNGNAPILELLLTAGASADAADAAMRDGRTMIMLAARTGSADAVNVLVRHGGNVNATESRTGTTALMHWSRPARTRTRGPR
jgi:hypothetical protein